ncbi:alpha/beta fold hydrolase [Cryobacterium algoritolerans]|uniref:Alpha/beta fold hydrolase n=1 Tax=Cryobacterium algoritolerans TaxID=1259184 RepID=A0A4R8WTG1_9MICO|nr:alpha/beta hydrolase [Cryobacterium algoritolerans]TFC13039.1 alpha/beta fold hydrolase [Cryobacterium algoritolerans]
MSYPLEHGAEATGTETIVFLHGGSVAAWSWQPQVAALPGRHVLTPDLPGFGDRSVADWRSLEETADDVAAIIAKHAHGARAHLVGLSLGGLVAVQVMARHPGLLHSCLVSGVPLDGIHGLARFVNTLHLRLWGRRWYWRAQSKAFGLPADAVTLFVEHGLGIRPDNAARVFEDVNFGVSPAGLDGYLGPLLAVAGEKESRLVRDSLATLRALLPQTRTWIAPGMHHVWSIEDAELFTRMVVGWVDDGTLPAGASLAAAD